MASNQSPEVIKNCRKEWEIKPLLQLFRITSNLCCQKQDFGGVFWISVKPLTWHPILACQLKVAIMSRSSRIRVSSGFGSSIGTISHWECKLAMFQEEGKKTWELKYENTRELKFKSNEPWNKPSDFDWCSRETQNPKTFLTSQIMCYSKQLQATMAIPMRVLPLLSPLKQPSRVRYT